MVSPLGSGPPKPSGPQRTSPATLKPLLALTVMTGTCRDCPQRVLVTGGACFVGATLVRRLAGSGNSARVFDNDSTGYLAYLDGVRAELVPGDIRDAGALGAALAGIDSIIHLAAAGSVVMSGTDPL